MKSDISSLPDDIETLKKLLVEERLRYEQLEEKTHILESDYHLLEEKYKTLQRRFFGRSSEKLTPEDELQGRLFDEAENEAAPEEECIEHEEEASVTKVKEHIRRKTGRKPLPEDLPREEVVHDIPEEEKRCSCCGKERKKIGTEETEELDIIPAAIKVIRHIRIKYGPCSCDGFLESEEAEIKTAPAPKRMIPGSIVSPGLLAYTIISKYADALPFYRQSKIFERIGVELSRATLCNWTIEAYEKMTGFMKVFEDVLKSGNFIRMDETVVQVLHEENRSPESKSYMWVSIGYPERGRPLVLYQYHPTRSKSIPHAFLEGFRGYLQTDGYDGYNYAASREGIIHVGCFAHARRYFFDASKLNKKDSRAHKGLQFIKRIYEVESELREKNLSDDLFVEQRKKSVLPVFDDFHRWLLHTKNEVIPKSKTGEAVNYTLNEWSKLIRYLDAAFMTPDNNETERAIRPFVIGRKNWLFSNTPRGANASAVMYSLIESTKANRLEPYSYLRFLFNRLPEISDHESLIALLPSRVCSEQLNNF